MRRLRESATVLAVMVLGFASGSSGADDESAGVAGSSSASGEETSKTEPDSKTDYVYKKDYKFIRYRPSNVFVNFLVFSYALLWNVYNLPSTLVTRRRTTRIVSIVRNRVSRESPSIR